MLENQMRERMDANRGLAEADTGLAERGLMDFLPEPVSSLALPETRQEQLPILPGDEVKKPGFKEAKFTEDPLAWLARGILGIAEFSALPIRTEMRQEELEEEGAEDPLAAYKEILEGLKEEYAPSAKAAAKIAAGGFSPTDPLAILGMKELGEETLERVNRSMQPLFDIGILLGMGAKLAKGKAKPKPKPVATEPVSPVETEFIESIMKPIEKPKVPEPKAEPVTGVDIIDETLGVKKPEIKKVPIGFKPEKVAPKAKEAVKPVKSIEEFGDVSPSMYPSGERWFIRGDATKIRITEKGSNVSFSTESLARKWLMKEYKKQSIVRPTVEKLKPVKVKVVEKAPVPKEPVIGLKKVEIEQLRKNMEISKLPPFEQDKWIKNASRAKQAKMDVNASSIADEVIASKRPTTADEHAGMSLRVAELNAEFKKSTQIISDLVDKGDITGAAIEKARRTTIVEQVDKITEASDLGGRENARALNIRRMFVSEEDLSILGSLREAKVAKGSKLTEVESAKVEKMAAKYEKAQKDYDRLFAEHEKTLADIEKVNAKKIVEKRKTIGEKSAKAKKTLADERTNLKKQLAKMGIRVNDITGVTAEGAHLVGKLGINYIKQGARTLEEVARLVRADVPDLTVRDVYKSLISKDPALQVKAKSAAVKSMAQLKRQAKLLLDIEKAEKGIFEPTRAKTIQPIEIRNLQKRLRNLRAEAYKSSLDAKKLETALKTINELQDMLENYHRAIKKQRPVETAELKTAKEKIKEIRKAMRVEDDLANLKEQLRTGEFEIRERPKPKELPPELERKRVELEMTRKQVRNAIRDMSPMTTGDVVGEIANFNRAALSTADMSGWFRQNVIPVFSHPIKTAKLAPKPTKAFFSNFQAEKIDLQLKDSPTRYLKDRAKLVFRELDGIPSTREESFMNRFIEKIPIAGQIAKASNRNMTVMGNMIRDSLFDDFLQKNPNATRAELAMYADFLNKSTGIGDLGSFAGAANKLSFGFFAPKLAVSRFQTPYQVFKRWKEPRVRKQIIRDLGGFVATGGTILALAALWAKDEPDLEVGNDHRSPDWGKIRYKNMRVDIWGGFQQPARFFTRVGLGITDKAGLTGQELTDAQKAVDPLELFWQLVSYKISPFIGLGRGIYTGKTAVGERVSVTDAMARSVTPLIIQDIEDAYKYGGLQQAVVTGALAFGGVGVNVYEDSRTTVQNKIRKLEDKKDYDAADKLRSEWNEANPNKPIKGVKSSEQLKEEEKIRKQKEEELLAK